MKSTNKTQNRSEQSNINYKAVFSGAALVTPVCFNPTAAQLREFKGIDDKFEVKEPEYKVTFKDGEEYTKISLLCKFNPNKIMKLVKPEYNDECWVTYSVMCQNKDRVGKATGKVQVIDEHNQSAWIKMTGKASLAKQIEKIQDEKDSNYHEKDSIFKIDAKTARIAKVGEVALYQLIFDMSTLDEHKPNVENPDRGTSLDEFVLGEDPSKTFENICEGDVSALNMLMQWSKDDFEGKGYYVKNGEQNKIGLILGGRESGDKIYQDALCPSPKAPNRCTWRPTDRMNQTTFGEYRISKDIVDQLSNTEYPWSAHWNNSLEFKLQELPKTEVKSEVKVADDDLPF